MTGDLTDDSHCLHYFCLLAKVKVSLWIGRLQKQRFCLAPINVSFYGEHQNGYAQRKGKEIKL